MPFWVRSFRPADAPALAALFFAAVRDGAATAYDERQRRAWAPAVPAGEAWLARLAGAETVVAEEEGTPIGFMSLRRADGHLDLAFVAPGRMGTGVAAAMYAVLESRARSAGIARLSSEASEFARPFLLRQGWSVTARQEIVRGGVMLQNTLMEKTLTRGVGA